MKLCLSVFLSLFSIFLWVVLHQVKFILSYPVVYWGIIIVIICRTIKEVYLFVKQHRGG